MSNIAIDPVVANGIVRLPLGRFADRFGPVMRRLTDFLCTEPMRRDPVWGALIPYDVLPYGNGRSLGHCLRPDIVLSTEGIKIVEVDFLPAGRGMVLAALRDETQKRVFLDPFADWYENLGTSQIAYATATGDPCFPDAARFADEVRHLFGVSIHAVNIDEAAPTGALIDRLFQRSELRDPGCIDGFEVVTKEPFLDSKMVFALVWDSSMYPALCEALGAERLALLREVMPETYAVKMLWQSDEGRALLHRAAERPEEWILKNTDVDTDTCWGCRGTILGQKYTGKKFREALLHGKAPNRKDLGRNPILQRFHRSLDFTPLWNLIAAGKTGMMRAEELGRVAGEEVRLPARAHVHARQGIYFLLNNGRGDVQYSPIGLLTLRQDPLSHGASDAIITAFQVA